MIQRIDHVNLVVRDMAAMVTFYRDVLGLQVTRRAVLQGPWIDRLTGLIGVEAEVVFLEMPEGPAIELLHYRSPFGTRPEGLERSNTPGLRHLAFRVVDLDAMVASMKARGATFLDEPQSVPAGQVDYADVRKRLAYFHDPEGNLLELCCYERLAP